MPFFTLVPCGCERSRMRRHFPGLLRFGITPNLLICKFTMIGSNGSLIILFASHSALKYSLMTSGCLYAKIMFRLQRCIVVLLCSWRLCRTCGSLSWFLPLCILQTPYLGEFGVPLANLGGVGVLWYFIKCLEVVLYCVACMLLELLVFEYVYLPSRRTELDLPVPIYSKQWEGEEKEAGF